MSKESNTKKLNGKVIFFTFLAVILLAGFIVCAGIMIRNYKIQRDAELQFEQMANSTIAQTEAPTETEIETETETEAPTFWELNGIEVPELNLDWNALWEQNTDIYAWIYIPNTNVNYPVLQHSSQHDYYLEYNIDHTKGRPGCIYSQRYNTTTFTDTNTILYGHNMKNGTMFKTLHYFEEEEFFNENRYIYIFTPEKMFVYEVYATTECSNEHLLYKYNFEKGEGKYYFIEDLQKKADKKPSVCHIWEETEITDDTKLLTLSTCILGRPSERYLVVGNLYAEETFEDGSIQVYESTEVTE